MVAIFNPRQPSTRLHNTEEDHEEIWFDLLKWLLFFSLASKQSQGWWTSSFGRDHHEMERGLSLKSEIYLWPQIDDNMTQLPTCRGMGNTHLIGLLCGLDRMLHILCSSEPKWELLNMNYHSIWEFSYLFPIYLLCLIEWWLKETIWMPNKSSVITVI